MVTRGRPEKRIPRLAKEIGATSVHVSADYSPFGRRRDDAVRDALGDVPLEEAGSPYLVSPGRVTKGDGTPYKVFTPVLRRLAPARLAAARQVGPEIGAVDRSRRRPRRGGHPRRRGGAGTACRRGQRRGSQWKKFVQNGLDDYAEDRNRPDLDSTSRMSAHLKFGTIHPRTMAADLGKGAGAQAYLRELAFRDFYAAVLYEWPDSAWWNWNKSFDKIQVDEDRALFDAWKAGRTGFPIVDAGMRQLAETGFMHNRVRMIVASFLVKDLHLPWQWGARWFLEQLVDGDMANNQHGWQWAAGCGTDAAPYFRVFNPTTQGKKFDPDGAYVRRWVPEVDDDDYPEPIVDHARNARRRCAATAQIS